MVEHHLAKVRVASSSLVSRSDSPLSPGEGLVFLGVVETARGQLRPVTGPPGW